MCSCMRFAMRARRKAQVYTKSERSDAPCSAGMSAYEERVLPAGRQRPGRQRTKQYKTVEVTKQPTASRYAVFARPAA